MKTTSAPTSKTISQTPERALQWHTARERIGGEPHIDQAIRASKHGSVGIMGVHSLIHSHALKDFVENNCPNPENIALINASPMVELVESGEFLFSPDKTRIAVSRFMDKLLQIHPQIDVLTLSSTHLPWLRSFFEDARPDIQFLDPAADIVAGIEEGTQGTGLVRGLASEDRGYELKTFQHMLTKIGVDIPLELI